MQFKSNKNIAIVFFILGCFLLSVTGIGQFSVCFNNSMSLLNLTLGCPVRTISVLNNHIIKVTDFDFLKKIEGKTHNKANPKENHVRGFNILFLTLNAVILTNRKLFLHFFKVVAESLENKLFGNADIAGKNASCITVRLRKYRMIAMAFLDPVRKAMKEMVELYSLIPLSGMIDIRLKESPHSKQVLRMRAFSFYKHWRVYGVNI